MLRIGSGNTDDLDRVHPWLDDQLRALPATMHHAMRVALEEAVMNIAMHGFAPGTAGEISIRFKTTPQDAMLVVEDAGFAFDPSLARISGRPAALADTRPGGMGLTLLRHYCKNLSYQRIGDRNQLTLRFPLPHSRLSAAERL